MSWKRWAAAAALAVVALSMPGDEARLHRTADLIAEATPAVLSAGSPEAVVLPTAVLPAEITDDLPIVEGVNGSDARVYQMESEELAVVMVVDESLTASVFAEL